jgi:hypothetical protein
MIELSRRDSLGGELGILSLGGGDSVRVVEVELCDDWGLVMVGPENGSIVN